MNVLKTTGFESMSDAEFWRIHCAPLPEFLADNFNAWMRDRDGYSAYKVAEIVGELWTAFGPDYPPVAEFRALPTAEHLALAQAAIDYFGTLSPAESLLEYLRDCDLGRELGFGPADHYNLMDHIDDRTELQRILGLLKRIGTAPEFRPLMNTVSVECDHFDRILAQFPEYADSARHDLKIYVPPQPDWADERCWWLRSDDDFALWLARPIPVEHSIKRVTLDDLSALAQNDIEKLFVELDCDQGSLYGEYAAIHVARYPDGRIILMIEVEFTEITLPDFELDIFDAAGKLINVVPRCPINGSTFRIELQAQAEWGTLAFRFKFLGPICLSQ